MNYLAEIAVLASLLVVAYAASVQELKGSEVNSGENHREKRVFFGGLVMRTTLVSTFISTSTSSIYSLCVVTKSTAAKCNSGRKKRRSLETDVKYYNSNEKVKEDVVNRIVRSMEELGINTNDVENAKIFENVRHQAAEEEEEVLDRYERDLQVDHGEVYEKAIPPARDGRLFFNSVTVTSTTTTTSTSTIRSTIGTVGLLLAFCNTVSITQVVPACG